MLAKVWVLDLKNVAVLSNYKNFAMISRENDLKLPLVTNVKITFNSKVVFSLGRNYPIIF